MAAVYLGFHFDFDAELFLLIFSGSSQLDVQVDQPTCRIDVG